MARLQQEALWVLVILSGFGSFSGLQQAVPCRYPKMYKTPFTRRPCGVRGASGAPVGSSISINTARTPKAISFGEENDKQIRISLLLLLLFLVLVLLLFRLLLRHLLEGGYECNCWCFVIICVRSWSIRRGAHVGKTIIYVKSRTHLRGVVGNLSNLKT